MMLIIMTEQRNADNAVTHATTSNKACEGADAKFNGCGSEVAPGVHVSRATVYYFHWLRPISRKCGSKRFLTPGSYLEDKLFLIF
jgi:hypothetical protein